MIELGNRRELFCDNYMVDVSATTAAPLLHSPEQREIVLTLDAPWEGDGCDYFNFINDNGTYRLYYLGWEMISSDKKKHTMSGIRVCYAESSDGLNWVKPELGICEFNGSKANNIILDMTTQNYDNFFVFIDENPACKPDERYKGVSSWFDTGKSVLRYYSSSDGIHFKPERVITDKGMFDTLNTVLWDAEKGKYFCYIRGFHDIPESGDVNLGIRDIRVLESEDFINWSDPVLLDFNGGEDYPLYTNCISKYYRAPHIYTGFPTRYVERKAWSDNFERLCGAEKRKERIKIHPRYGLTVTDCVFMTSRDGYKWNRFDEAYMRPGPEFPNNWVYGSCYPAVGMTETPPQLKGAANEISMYAFINHWSGEPAQILRYANRIDGFVSYHSTYKPQKLVTKPFKFTGESLTINFSTSARGYMYIKLTDTATGCTIESGELFGDAVDRVVDFNGEVKKFSGEPVIMEITMSDADIYSFKFN